ncbi:uncharacterized protein LOC144153168 [Haemaphysalis longicornis]
MSIAAQAAVIFGMYRFYRNMDTLMSPSKQPWAQPAGQGTDGYPVQQGYPAAAGGGAGTSYPPYPVVNTYWLFYYGLYGNRRAEELAKNNWKRRVAEERQKNTALGLEHGPEEKHLGSTTTKGPQGYGTEVPSDVTKEPPQSATMLNTPEEIPVSGFVFDLIFGTETALNLVSDIMMQGALYSWKTPGAKGKLGLYLVWNCCTTGLCYIASLFFADFNSKIVGTYPTEGRLLDDATARSRARIMMGITYTAVFLVKLVNGLWLLYYATFGNRTLEGVWVFMDILFAGETALNLGSDFLMEYVLMSQVFNLAGETISPAARKTIFKYSLIWKCCSTGLCYVASLGVAYLRSKGALWTAFRQKQQEKYSEPYSGMKVTLYFAITYTIIAAVKAAVLFGMYRFYRNFDTLVIQSTGQAYNFQQGYPSVDGGVAPGTYPPYATADPGTAAASYPPYPASAPGTAAAASYPPYPAAAPGTAAAASYLPYPTAGSGTAPGSNPPYPAFAPETARSSYPPYPVAGS